MIEIQTPISDEVVQKLNVGDMVYISGEIFCGRDAVLPKVVQMIENETIADVGIELKGSAIFHTAVSPAGVGPTSSNKLEIESSMKVLSQAGVKFHIGKGKISEQTIETLKENNSVYLVMPPVTALLESKTLEKKLVAFPELGMEALYQLKVERYPAIVGAAHGRSIYE